MGGSTLPVAQLTHSSPTVKRAAEIGFPVLREPRIVGVVADVEALKVVVKASTLQGLGDYP